MTLIDDIMDGVITLLLDDTTTDGAAISDIISDRLLKEDGNTPLDDDYPYGEVISLTKGKGQFESGGFRDVKVELIIQFYTNDLDGDVGKSDLKILAEATEKILEKNFSYSTLWRDVEWQGTRVDGFTVDSDVTEGPPQPVERFAQVRFAFFAQVRR